MTAKVTFSGGPELDRALRELGSKVASRLGENAVRAGARVIASDARRRVPIRTGDLKQSIRDFRDVERRGGERTAYAGTRLFYAIFVEFGTVHSAAKAFLRPALDEKAAEAGAKMAANLAAGIERETAKYRGK